MSDRKQPPLGLRPKAIWQSQRRDEIIEAINRYREGHYIIPSKWIEELLELTRELEGSE